MTQKEFIRKGLVLIIVLGLNSASFGQLKKAHAYFNQENFSDAITYYGKVLKKDASNNAPFFTY